VPPARQVRAQADKAPIDLPMARRLLEQADRHLASAAIPGVDADSRFGMLYDAARKAADATMRAAGRRVTQGVGHHIVFFAEAKRLLPSDQSPLITRVEGARAIRNGMEYRGREVTDTEVQDLAEAAAQLFAAARAYVDSSSARS
jgi:hypothetical protein